MMRRAVLALLLVALVLLAWPFPSAQAQEASVWEIANEIRDLNFQAQQKLFVAQRSAEATQYYIDAATLIEQASTRYNGTLHSTIQQFAPDTDTVITAAFASALEAAGSGDGAALALARGQIWSALLQSAYTGTFYYLEANDYDTAREWLRLREYRQATKVTLVKDLAAQALSDLQTGIMEYDAAVLAISNDLRDTYFFRLRTALAELQDAAKSEFGVRSAEWAALVNGYTQLLKSDMSEKLGTEAVASLDTQLQTLETDTLAADWGDIQADVQATQTLLQDYQAVELNEKEIEEHAQRLYLFLGLISVEYGRGVRQGEISIPIEYQEATTFLKQSLFVFQELRPVLTSKDPVAAGELESLLTQIDTAVANIDDPKTLKTLTDDAQKLVKETLEVKIDANSTESSFIIIESLLKDVLTAAREGRYADAELARLEAYGILDSGTEMLIFAFDPALGAKIEALFWHGDGKTKGLAELLANKAPASEVQVSYKALTDSLNQGRVLIGAGSSARGAIIFNTATIVFREGLEAVVILAALMASLIGERQHYRRPLWVGAFVALIVTALTWIVAQSLLSAFSGFGQKLEAVVSLIAVGVLLLITNWFFHKVYWTGWMANFHKKKSRIISAEMGQFISLILLGFTSVYREGFETVLFLQALVLDAGTMVVLEGVALGMVGVVLVGIITFKFQKKLPYRQMLVFTGILIGSVLLTMVGNTVHVMQVVGWLPITPIEGLHLPYWMGLWFGFFPTWQGILFQIGAAVFVIGSYYLAEYQNSNRRENLKLSRQQSKS